MYGYVKSGNFRDQNWIISNFRGDFKVGFPSRTHSLFEFVVGENVMFKLNREQKWDGSIREWASWVHIMTEGNRYVRYPQDGQRREIDGVSDYRFKIDGRIVYKDGSVTRDKTDEDVI